VEEKTRTPDNYPQLGVEEVNSPKASGTRVEAVTPTKTYALIVGKSSSAKSGYVRMVGVPQSLLAAPMITLDADPHHWLDHTLIDIPQDRVKEIAVKPADGTGYTATRATKEQPDFTVAGIPKGRELSSSSAADSIASSLAALTSDDVRRTSTAQPAASTSAVGAPATPVGTAAPPALSHAIFHTFDGVEIDVAGHKEGTKTFVSFTEQPPNAQLKDWEYEIPSYKYDAIFRPLDELLKKLPEPAPKKADAGKPKAGKKPAASMPPPPVAAPAN
jgi:hypothetical protein